MCLIALSFATGVLVDPTQTRDPNDMREDERIAEMGKPRLGDTNKVRVTIKESSEFKVSKGVLNTPDISGV